MWLNVDASANSKHSGPISISYKQWRATWSSVTKLTARLLTSAPRFNPYLCGKVGSKLHPSYYYVAVPVNARTSLCRWAGTANSGQCPCTQELQSRVEAYLSAKLWSWDPGLIPRENVRSIFRPLCYPNSSPMPL